MQLEKKFFCLFLLLCISVVQAALEFSFDDTLTRLCEKALKFGPKNEDSNGCVFDLLIIYNAQRNNEFSPIQQLQKQIMLEYLPTIAEKYSGSRFAGMYVKSNGCTEGPCFSVSHLNKQVNRIMDWYSAESQNQNNQFHFNLLSPVFSQNLKNTLGWSDNLLNENGKAVIKLLFVIPDGPLFSEKSHFCSPAFSYGKSGQNYDILNHDCVPSAPQIGDVVKAHRITPYFFVNGKYIEEWGQFVKSVERETNRGVLVHLFDDKQALSGYSPNTTFTQQVTLGSDEASKIIQQTFVKYLKTSKKGLNNLKTSNDSKSNFNHENSLSKHDAIISISLLPVRTISDQSISSLNSYHINTPKTDLVSCGPGLASCITLDNSFNTTNQLNTTTSSQNNITQNVTQHFTIYTQQNPVQISPFNNTKTSQGKKLNLTTDILHHVDELQVVRKKKQISPEKILSEVSNQDFNVLKELNAMQQLNSTSFLPQHNQSAEPTQKHEEIFTSALNMSSLAQPELSSEMNSNRSSLTRNGTSYSVESTAASHLRDFHNTSMQSSLCGPSEHEICNTSEKANELNISTLSENFNVSSKRIFFRGPKNSTQDAVKILDIGFNPLLNSTTSNITENKTNVSSLPSFYDNAEENHFKPKKSNSPNRLTKHISFSVLAAGAGLMSLVGGTALAYKFFILKKSNDSEYSPSFV